MFTFSRTDWFFFLSIIGLHQDIYKYTLCIISYIILTNIHYHYVYTILMRTLTYLNLHIIYYDIPREPCPHTPNSFLTQHQVTLTFHFNLPIKYESSMTIFTFDEYLILWPQVLFIYTNIIMKNMIEMKDLIKDNQLNFLTEINHINQNMIFK